mmetsp:Transcript_30578/g.49295  ORF Transcript_30578/g.49295 Transcript_30578/m.49295 type:complete len:104 (+) Transcript_30578:54-365(+)
MPQALVFGTTLAARVAHYWSLTLSSDSDSNPDSDDDSDGDALSVSTSSDCDSQLENGDDEPEVEVVWAKAACGVWGQGHVFDGKLYLGTLPVTFVRMSRFRNN